MTYTDESGLTRMGDRLRVLRQMQGLTQVALAAKVFVSQPTLSCWENGRFPPSRSHQFDIADALGTTRSMLFREIAEAENAAAA